MKGLFFIKNSSRVCPSVFCLPFGATLSLCIEMKVNDGAQSKVLSCEVFCFQRHWSKKQANKQTETNPFPSYATLVILYLVCKAPNQLERCRQITSFHIFFLLLLLTLFLLVLPFLNQGSPVSARVTTVHVVNLSLLHLGRRHLKDGHVGCHGDLQGVGPVLHYAFQLWWKIDVKDSHCKNQSS